MAGVATIKVNGQEAKAYDLIMRKEHALDIISGKKTLEIRAYSDHYGKLFFNHDVAAANKKLIEEGREDECEDATRTDIAYIHFHNYNNSWQLDVRIDDLGLTMMVEDELKLLVEWFDFHDYDDEWQQFVGKPEDEIPMFFWLHIAEVVNRVNI